MTIRQAADFTGLSKSKVGRYYKDFVPKRPSVPHHFLWDRTGIEPDWILSVSPQDSGNISKLVKELELITYER